MQVPLPFGNQRWRRGRSSYRVPDEVINTRRYEVAPIAGDTEARAFVVDHHYSGSYPAALYRVGLYRTGELVGVAVFSVPMNPLTVPKWAGRGAVGCELGRFVLLDDVPGNGETWFLSRARKLLKMDRPDLEYIVSFSDPVPRHDAGGAETMPGHLGTIYQASNARFCGRGTPRTLLFAPNGALVSNRALSKVRSGERGQEYAERQLRDLGAPARGRREAGDAYVRRVLESGLLRRSRHPGNLVYVFGQRRHLPNERAYPKRRAA